MKLFAAFAVICLLYSSYVCANPANKENDHFYLRSLNSIRRAKSCLDFLKDGLPESGYYQIFDNDNVRYTVYCDFTSEPGAAWTLVLSYIAERRYMQQFRLYLLKDLPVNEKTANWQAYRMTLAMMVSVATHSTHWRYTCSFPEYGVDYTDYARAKISSLNPLTFDKDGACVTMEYVNVRGHACANCRAQWWQPKTSKRILHLDSYKNNCNFKVKSGAIKWEDNFGFYDNSNSKFRCSKNAASSSNLWFGAYL